MIDRINEVKRVTERDTEQTAKEAGFDSYEAMKKAKEEKLVETRFRYEEKRLLKPLLEQRLADDPRLKN